jgi:hypothetical protein
LSSSSSPSPVFLSGLGDGEAGKEWREEKGGGGGGGGGGLMLHISLLSLS